MENNCLGKIKKIKIICCSPTYLCKNYLNEPNLKFFILKSKSNVSGGYFNLTFTSAGSAIAALQLDFHAPMSFCPIECYRGREVPVLLLLGFLRLSPSVLWALPGGKQRAKRNGSHLGKETNEVYVCEIYCFHIKGKLKAKRQIWALNGEEVSGRGRSFWSLAGAR